MKIFKNKKILIGSIIIIGIVILLILAFSNNESDKNMLSVTYSDGEKISFDNFNKKFNKQKKIIIENKSKKNRTYALKWINVKNTLKKQNTFLYKIGCIGESCLNTGKSQVPVTDSVLFEQVLIGPLQKQEYIIAFDYSGSSQKAQFEGILKVQDEKMIK